MFYARLLLILGLLGAGPVQAQLLVHDPISNVNHTVTAIQTTATTIEAVLQTGYMLLEITGVESLALDDNFTADLVALSGLLGEGAGIAWDLASITRQVMVLFSIESTVDHSTGLWDRSWEFKMAIFSAYLAAIRVQTLIRTAIHTVEHIRRFVGRIRDFVGNMQANQNVNEALATLARIEATQTATVTAFQRAQALEALEEPFLQISLLKINQQLMVDYPQ